jgi:hypothetical protein
MNILIVGGHSGSPIFMALKAAVPSANINVVAPEAFKPKAPPTSADVVVIDTTADTRLWSKATKMGGRITWFVLADNRGQVPSGFTIEDWCAHFVDSGGVKSLYTSPHCQDSKLLILRWYRPLVFGVVEMVG